MNVVRRYRCRPRPWLAPHGGRLHEGQRRLKTPQPGHSSKRAPSLPPSDSGTNCPCTKIGSLVWLLSHSLLSDSLPHEFSRYHSSWNCPRYSASFCLLSSLSGRQLSGPLPPFPLLSVLTSFLHFRSESSAFRSRSTQGPEARPVSNLLLCPSRLAGLDEPRLELIARRHSADRYDLAVDHETR